MSFQNRIVQEFLQKHCGVSTAMEMIEINKLDWFDIDANKAVAAKEKEVQDAIKEVEKYIKNHAEPAAESLDNKRKIEMIDLTVGPPDELCFKRFNVPKTTDISKLAVPKCSTEVLNEIFD